MFSTLETERLILREILFEDRDATYNIFSNEQVTKYYVNLELKRGMRWGIERKSIPGLIGTIGFNLWSPAHKRSEIGYDIYPDYWRLGYASEAVAKVVEYGFQELELNRIGAIVFVENEASSQLLMRQGFEKEGTLKKYIYQNEQAFDVNVFAKLNG